MREYRFRGKRVDDGKWVYGCVILHNEFAFIANGNATLKTPYKKHNLHSFNGIYEVIPETVGQYTGLKDKNGKEVFEGDIVIAWSQGQKEICKVKWGQGRVGFFLYRSPNIIWHLSGGGFDYTFEMIEIIGNIYENTELVGENNG